MEEKIVYKDQKLYCNDELLAEFNGSEGFTNIVQVRGYVVDKEETMYFLQKYEMNEDEEHVITYLLQKEDSEILYLKIIFDQNEEYRIETTI